MADQPERQATPEPPEPLDASEEERRVLEALGPEPAHVDELARAMGAPVAQVAGTLALLVLRGLARGWGRCTTWRSGTSRSGPRFPPTLATRSLDNPRLLTRIVEKMPTSTKTSKTTKKTTLKRPAARRTDRAPRDDGAATGGRGRHLVVVESPAKATTIGRMLGRDYTVKASMGHVRDLPEGQLGVDKENSFTPSYQVMKEKKTVIADLKKAAENAEDIYLATDPDREGEAISWHLYEAAGWKSKPVRRVVFHAITQEAIKEAFANHREIDMQLVNAQQARRVLDRLVGYELSPLLWRKVQRGLSAGRVQSVALRLVVERDREIDAFTPREFWSIEAALAAQGGGFSAALHSRDGEKGKLQIADQAAAERIMSELRGAAYAVRAVTKREVKRRPAPPFITSTLQQEASRHLRFSATRTMQLAQQLYEGIDLGGADGPVGLITYMRTDSPQVAPEALTQVRGFIERTYGKEYLPTTARMFTSKSKVAQEAHEAIRPTSIPRTPESMAAHLSRDQFRLYELVWKRMVSSQMADAILDATRVEVLATPRTGAGYVFRASGSVLRFPGFRAVYMEAQDEKPARDGEDEDEDERDADLPALTKGEMLTCSQLNPSQHFTQPPPRYTEASIIKALEEHGIGRPSTYAPIISTLVSRQYVNRERSVLTSTKLGQVVCDQLMAHFPEIMNLEFTAQLEERLDQVANGKQDWVPLLRGFYDPFAKELEEAQEKMPRVRIEEPTDEVCEVCGRPMVIKSGRFGPFLSCTGFPECKTSRPIRKKTGAKCPVDGGELLERKGKGRTFYGCSNYPACNFTVSSRPLPEACPECEGLLVSAGRNRAKCTNCAYVGPVPEEEPAGAV
ncbi:MAG: type I DNA topoisomerase [Chloroflexota bacterium]